MSSFFGPLMALPVPLQSFPYFFSMIFILISFWAAFTDYRFGKVYNPLTFSCLALGLVSTFAFRGEHGLVETAYTLTGFLFVLAVFLPLFVLRIVGGGDVKLLLALSTILGFSGSLELVKISFTLAALTGVILLIRHRRIKIFFHQLYLFMRSFFLPGLTIQWPKLSREIRVPFAVAVFLAFLKIWFDKKLLQM